MSPEDHLAWPKPRMSGPNGREPAGGTVVSKKRSPASDGVHARSVASASATAESTRHSARVVAHYVPGEARCTARLIRTESGFEALSDAWFALLAESADATVFTSHEWLYTWWTAYRPDAELAIVVAEAGGRVRGIAPLMIERVRKAGFTARVLRFLGDGTGETDHINLLVPGTNREEILGVLLTTIAALDWDVAEFNQMPESSATTADMLDWIRRAGLRSVVSSSPCPVRHLPSTADALMASLPSRLRTTIRSSSRKLRERHGMAFGLHDRAAELDAALKRFFEIHESRWQEGKGIAGAFSNPRRRSFYEGLTPRLLERGWLRFFYLKLDERIVAQQYCFCLDGTVMLLQEGFDFSHAADNVGNVLRAMVFDHLIQSGVVCYDFLAGTSRHKQSWSDGTVMDLRIHCARRSLRGWLFLSLPLLLERAKDRLRPWRDRILGRSAHGSRSSA